jgi:hypothetical protein
LNNRKIISSLASLAILGTTALYADTVRDEFSTKSYNNNDGTSSWSSAWVEGYDNKGASGGNVQVYGNKLYLHGYRNYSDERY